MTAIITERASGKGAYAAPFDFDNHYYEAVDAFSRHLPKEFKNRGVEVIRRGSHTDWLAGGVLWEFIANPTFDPVIVPGCLDPLFRGQIPEGVDPCSLAKLQQVNPAFQNREARVATMKAQNMSGMVLFPTAGQGVETALRNDVPATMATVTAFNKWLEDDWGYAYENMLFAAPMLSLADPDVALAELNRVIAKGARIVSMRPAPVPTADGRSNSLGNPIYDKVWARLAEAQVTVGFHLADSGYNGFFGKAWGGPDRFVPFRNPDVLSNIIVADRAIHDTLASMIVHGVFTRHPGLRVASVENGTDWIQLLVKRLRKQANQSPWEFVEDPLDTVRKHLWASPYYEEDLRKLANLIGADRILFGSDWPHGEGLENPIDFQHELADFAPEDVDKIMRTNGLDLLNLPH